MLRALKVAVWVSTLAVAYRVGRYRGTQQTAAEARQVLARTLADREPDEEASHAS